MQSNTAHQHKGNIANIIRIKKGGNYLTIN